MNVSDDRVNLWAKAISETEEAKCQNALSMVTEAMRERFGNGVTVIQQGSHKNRTNIRADSDVDIAVVYDDSFFSDVAALSLSDQQTHWNTISLATYTFSQFKQDVHAVLIGNFGSGAVARKNKCIRIEGNTYRVSADVVPAVQSMRYSALRVPSHIGIGFLTDDGKLIHSFPEQHYKSGVRKNDVTNNGYKAAVRVLKNTRNEMVDTGLIAKDSMPSFFLECLVWNAPNSCFQHQTYKEDARAVALHVWSEMRVPETARNYREVSELKWLLREAHRTPAQAEAFMLAAWAYLEP